MTPTLNKILEKQIEYPLDELFNQVQDCGDEASCLDWSLKDLEDYIYDSVSNTYYETNGAFLTQRRNTGMRFFGKTEIKNTLRKMLLETYPILDDMEEVAGKTPRALKELRELQKKSPQTNKGFKTATYGRKGHRNSITQLENSVRRMF